LIHTQRPNECIPIKGGHVGHTRQQWRALMNHRPFFGEVHALARWQRPKISLHASTAKSFGQVRKTSYLRASGHSAFLCVDQPFQLLCSCANLNSTHARDCMQAPSGKVCYTPAHKDTSIDNPTQSDDFKAKSGINFSKPMPLGRTVAPKMRPAWPWL